MSWLTRKYYVYVIFSLRGLYVGKGSGDRVRESMKERHGLFYWIRSRHINEKAAYRAEARLINFYHSIGVPLQNGRAPRSEASRWISSSRRSKKKMAKSETIFATIILMLVLWLLAA